MSNFDRLSTADVVAAATVADADFFWSSFKSAVEGQKIPTSGHAYAKGGQFNIECGVTVISATVRASGELLEVFKRADVDDAKYLTEAGFERNRNLEIPVLSAAAPTCAKE